MNVSHAATNGLGSCVHPNPYTIRPCSLTRAAEAGEVAPISLEITQDPSTLPAWTDVHGIERSVHFASWRSCPIGQRSCWVGWTESRSQLRVSARSGASTVQVAAGTTSTRHPVQATSPATAPDAGRDRVVRTSISRAGRTGPSPNSTCAITRAVPQRTTGKASCDQACSKSVGAGSTTRTDGHDPAVQGRSTAALICQSGVDRPYLRAVLESLPQGCGRIALAS